MKVFAGGQAGVEAGWKGRGIGGKLWRCADKVLLVDYIRNNKEK